MSHYTLDSGIHGGDREAAKENDGLDRAADLGERDARSNLTCAPLRHGLHCLEASEYRRSYQAEVDALVAYEQRRLQVQEVTEKNADLIRSTIKLMGLDGLERPRAGSQRYRVRHYSRQNALLNENTPGFASYDEAALCRDELLEDESLLHGDYITIEDQGCIIELHEHKPGRT